MRGPLRFAVACVLLAACGRSAAADHTELCQDLVNLQATVQFLAAPDPHAELRNGARYATDGIGPDLLIAARDAIRRMIEWLGREHGLEPVQAYLLCSVAVDLRISEIVDVPNFIVTAYCPLGIFE